MSRLGNYPCLASRPATLMWIAGILFLAEASVPLPMICPSTCTCSDLTNVICDATGYAAQEL